MKKEVEELDKGNMWELKLEINPAPSHSLAFRKEAL